MRKKEIWRKDVDSKIGHVMQWIEAQEIEDNKVELIGSMIVSWDKDNPNILSKGIRTIVEGTIDNIDVSSPAVNQMFIALYGLKQWLQDKVATKKGEAIKLADVKVAIARYMANDCVRASRTDTGAKELKNAIQAALAMNAEGKLPPGVRDALVQLGFLKS